MKRLSHLLLSLLFATPLLGGADPSPKRWIDSKGHGILWTVLERLSDGKQSVPITLRYNSGSDRGTILPPQWDIPLLESRVVRVSERLCEVVLPDGSMTQFDVDEDGRVIGAPSGTKAESRGNMVSLEQEGHRYVFERGLLRQHVMPDGSTLEWRLDDSTKPRRLLMNGREVLEVERQEQGATGKLLLRDLVNGKRTMLHYDILPSGMKTVKEVLQMAGPALYQVDLSNGLTIKLFTKREGDKQSMLIEGWPEMAEPLHMVVGPTNSLERINGTHYQVEYRDDGENRSSLPLITATDSKSGMQVLQQGSYYSKKLAAKFRFDLENTWQSYYVMTPAGSQLRKELLNGKEVYKAYFDKDGKKMVSIENGVRIDWHQLLKQEQEQPDFTWPWPGSNEQTVQNNKPTKTSKP